MLLLLLVSKVKQKMEILQRIGRVAVIHLLQHLVQP